MPRKKRKNQLTLDAPVTQDGITYNPDGSRSTGNLLWLQPGQVYPLIDGYPQGVWSTLADNEDEEGRCPGDAIGPSR